MAAKGVKRQALFLQTKFTSVDGQDHRTPYNAAADLTTQVEQSFASSLQHLHTDYLDSYVLHAPFSRRGLGAADWQVWAAMEAFYEAGKTKTIGVSNITAAQLTLLCQQARVKPMMVQNRCFAVTAWDQQVREICREQGLSIRASRCSRPIGTSLLRRNTCHCRARGCRAGAGDFSLRAASRYVGTDRHDRPATYGRGSRRGTNHAFSRRSATDRNDCAVRFWPMSKFSCIVKA